MRKRVLEEIPVGKDDIDRSLEDIGRNGKDRYAGRLGGNKQYINSSDSNSELTCKLSVETVRVIDLQRRRRGKKKPSIIMNVMLSFLNLI